MESIILQLKNPVSLSFLSYIRCSSPIVIIIKLVSVSLFNWEAHSWAQHSMCVSPELRKVKDHLQGAGNPVPNAWGFWLSLVQGHKSFSAKWSISSLVWCMALFPPRILLNFGGFLSAHLLACGGLTKWQHNHLLCQLYCQFFIIFWGSPLSHHPGQWWKW